VPHDVVLLAQQLRLLKDSGDSQFVKSDEPAYTMGLSVNAMPDTPWVRYTYTSLTTPATTYEINVETGERKQLKQDPVPGFDPTQYVTERAWVPSRDGTVRIPVSIVYRKGFEKSDSVEGGYLEMLKLLAFKKSLEQGQLFLMVVGVI
jgi:oligopeptidase B